MTQGKRGRGRPKGSGRDDSETLTKMAHLIDSGKKVRTAIREVVTDWDENTVRRLSRKWLENRTALLTAIKIERENASAAAQRLAQSRLDEALEKVGASMRRFGEPTVSLLTPNVMRQIAEASRFYESDAAKAARAAFESTQMQKVLEIQRNPIFQKIVDASSMGMKAYRIHEEMLRSLGHFR